MKKQKRLNRRRTSRKYRVSNAVKRNSTRPRLAVFRSAKHIYAQIIDDLTHKTLAASNTMDKDFRALGIYGGNVVAAAEVGKLLAQKAIAAGVTAVAFDRHGFKYHGRVKALADSVRTNGIDIGAGGEAKE